MNKSVKNNLWAAIGVLSLASLFYWNKRRPKQLFQDKNKPERKNLDKIDEASMESFPASDSPAW